MQRATYPLAINIIPHWLTALRPRGSIGAYVLVNDFCKGFIIGGTSQTQRTTTSAVAGTTSTALKTATSSLSTVGTGTVTSTPTGTAANQSPGSRTESTPSRTNGDGSSPTGRDQAPSSSSSLSTGAKAGIGIGAVVGCAVVVLLVYIALLLRKRSGKSQPHNGDGDEGRDGTPGIVPRAPELDGASVAVAEKGKSGFLRSKQWDVEAKGDDGNEIVVDVGKEGDGFTSYGGAPGGVGVQVEELDGQTRAQLDDARQPRNLNPPLSPVQVRRGVVGELPG